mgnify:CR=1 FL=1|jgi:hypothetical protein
MLTMNRQKFNKIRHFYKNLQHYDPKIREDVMHLHRNISLKLMLIIMLLPLCQKMNFNPNACALVALFFLAIVIHKSYRHIKPLILNAKPNKSC